MKRKVDKGSEGVILTVFFLDSASSVLAGLGSLDENSNIVGGAVREGSTGVALAVDEDVAVEGTYQAPSSSAHVRIGTPANKRTGAYELHLHNDWFLTGAEALSITLGGATTMADFQMEIQLDDGPSIPVAVIPTHWHAQQSEIGWKAKNSEIGWRAAPSEIGWSAKPLFF